jgi:tRNA threonylcarbamoyl adenosine modification protein YeaZ
VLLLGLDTATPAVTVALHDGTRVLAEATTVARLTARHAPAPSPAGGGGAPPAKGSHSELLAPAIAQVLVEAGVDRGDLTAVAVGVGPGPYTGLRVGIVTARVLGAVLGIPVHGVCSLDIIAADVEAPRFLVATDARRREVYYACYDETGRYSGPAVDRPGDIEWPDGLPAVGEGARMYDGIFPPIIGDGPLYPSAATLCRIVAAELTDDFPPGTARQELPLLPPVPLYLRRPDAREPGAPKRVTERDRGAAATGLSGASEGRGSGAREGAARERPDASAGSTERDRGAAATGLSGATEGRGSERGKRPRVAPEATGGRGRGSGARQ